MKKVLSLVLAFAMILGSFGFVFASQYSDVADNKYYSEPINVLSGLGVVNGMGNGKFEPDGNVTRAQMAVMLINCLGIPVGGKTDTGFTDCTSAHWASPWVKYAANLGIVAGVGNGLFKPDDPVTYDQALTMIVASLGYTSEGLGGTWPGNFVNQARALGILDTCKTTGSAEATRGDICCFLYDALETPMGKTNKDGEFVATQPKPGEYDTILKRLGATPYDGDGDGEPDEIIWGDDANPAAVADMSQYFGQRITVMVNKSGEVVSVKEVLTTDVIETTYNKMKKAYKNFDSVKGDDALCCFYNGEDDGYWALADYEGGYEDDTITVALTLSGSKIVSVDSIQEWYVDEDGFAPDDVQEVIADKQTLLGEDLPVDEDGEIDTTAFVILGRDSLEDIAEDDVVFVYVGPNSGAITKIEVGTETVEGKISKINVVNGTITISGKAYDYSEGSNAIAFSDLQAAMGNKAEGTFYLDYAGAIYDFAETAAETTDAYGVALRVWTEQHEDDYVDMVEVYTAEGKAVKYELDASFPGNGQLALITLDEDDVITKMDQSGINYESSPVDVSKNGLFNGNKITSSTLVIKFAGDIYDTDSLKASKNYSLGEASDLFGETIESMMYILDGKTVKALVYTDVAAEESTDMAFFVDFNGTTTPEGIELVVLNNGKVEELNVKSSVLSSIHPFTPYALSIKDDVVTGVTDLSGKIKDGMNVAISSTDTTSVSGNVFTSIDGTNYDLASDIIVYVCDADGEWSVGTTAKLKAKNGNLDEIEFLETSGDGAWDIVFVWEN